MKTFEFAVLAAVAAVGFGSAASAHTLKITCYSASADKVTCEGGYSDGKIPSGADIKVVTEKGAVLTQGKTDAKGVYTFAKPKGEYAVILQSGPQHITNISSADIK